MKRNLLILAAWLIALYAILCSSPGCVSSVSPLDRLVIREGCRQTIAVDLRIIDDEDCPQWIKAQAQLQILRAEALMEWTATGRFPIGAPTGEETCGK